MVAENFARTGVAECQPQSETLVDEVLRGLRAHPKTISSLFFYDATGSGLFERICDLPEYYLTRAELDILREHAPEMSTLIGPDAMMIELGSGSSTKTKVLLDALPSLAVYVPVDISRSMLATSARVLAARYPRIEVLPICADFTGRFPVPAGSRPAARRAAFFPGSTIGNFDLPATVRLLQTIRDIVGPAGGLIIGVDVAKDPKVLQSAYDDSQGVTAAFNLNVLARLNREFGADFDLDAFVHRAPWNEAEQRIEMHLVSTRAQTVSICCHVIRFAAGETIRTELCHKYTSERFAEIIQTSGWNSSRVWLDSQERFSVHYLTVAASA
jgi:L-histidine Nalpha-methyltransferase